MTAQKTVRRRIPRRILKLRRALPSFVRQESWRYLRVSRSWRRPRGKDSRTRLQRRGAPPLVKIGYRTPRSYRGIHPSGYKEVLVKNVKELEEISPDTQAVRILGRLSKRKKAVIAEEARKRGMKILNAPVTRGAPPESPAEAEREPAAEQEEIGEEKSEQNSESQ